VSEALRISPQQQLLNKNARAFPRLLVIGATMFATFLSFRFLNMRGSCSQLLIMRKYRRMTELNGPCGQETMVDVSEDLTAKDPESSIAERPSNQRDFRDTAICPLDPEK